MLQFEHTVRDEDGGGFVTLTADGTKDVGFVQHHYNFGRREPAIEMLLAEAEQLKQGHLVKVLDKGSVKRPWYVYEGYLGGPFLEPYAELLLKVTGFKLSDINMDLTPIHPKRLCFAKLTNWMHLNSGVLTYEVFVESEDWDRRKAAARVEYHAKQVIEDDFGERPVEREYIENGNGTYSRNPRYATYHPPKPALKNEWFWLALMEWWRDNHATEGQKEVMRLDEELHTNNMSGKYRCASWMMRVNYQGLRTNWTDKEITWEQFKTL